MGEMMKSRGEGSSTKYGRAGGLVFDIQRFSVHDGPGIRTTVFMKGCPLRCLWCSNPESQNLDLNLVVNDLRCRSCGACAEACPTDAIHLDPDEGRSIDWEKCDQCLSCIERCLFGGLEVFGRYTDVAEIMDEIRRDEAFYRNSGGGVTVSGGEPLIQGDFVVELLEACRSEGFHTCLDTTGHAPWETMERVLGGVGLLLFDIKHLDDSTHKKTTGVGNELILSNLRKSAEIVKIWLRIPLIAGYNDSEEHIENIADLGNELGVEKISLLPYHEGGKSKCERMGRIYPFEEGRAPSQKHIDALKAAAEEKGIPVSVGR